MKRAVSGFRNLLFRAKTDIEPSKANLLDESLERFEELQRGHTKAPRYAGEQAVLERSKPREAFTPHDLEQKDNEFADALKQVFVKSAGSVATIGTHAHAALKSDNEDVVTAPKRNAEPDLVYGFAELNPDSILAGKLSFRESVEMMDIFQAAPDRENFARIQDNCRLSDEQLKKMFRYFALFQRTQDAKLIDPDLAMFRRGFYAMKFYNPHIKDVLNYKVQKEAELNAAREERLQKEKAEADAEFMRAKQQESLREQQQH